MTRKMHAVRQGPIKPTGAYFSLPGSSTYFDPSNPGANCYDLGGVRILDVREDRAAALTLFLSALALCGQGMPHDPTAKAQLLDELVAMQAGEEPFLGYMLADQTPMAQAARDLGYGGLLIWENDDWSRPSSVFAWELNAVRELRPSEREELVREFGDDVDDVQSPRP